MSAVDAALTVARAHGLPTDRARVLRDLTNVIVHLEPAPVVARVPVTLARLRGADWFAREIELARFLTDAGAPIVPPAPDVDPGPHEHDGFHVTLWRYVDHDPEGLDAYAAGESLRELHEALAPFPGDLPSCDRLGEVRRLLAELEPTNDVTPAELAGLRALAGRLESQPGRPIHGDAHLGNILWSRDGPLWSDLENACAGPVEYDLACLRFRGKPEAEVAIVAYGTHDGARIDELGPCLALFLAAWTLVVVERTENPAAHAEARRRVRYALEM